MQEIWKAIPGYECFYEVSNIGRVRSLDRMTPAKNGALNVFTAGKLISQCNGTLGRKQVRLARHGKVKNFRVHQLVMLAFIGPCPDGMECCHNDGNPQNNNLSNIRYDTRLSNAKDRIIHKTVLCGSKNKKAKLTEETALEILEKFKNGKKGSALAIEYGVTHTLISLLCKRKIWKHL